MIMNIEKYLKENIDEKIDLFEWNERKEVSVYLRSKYNFYELIILGRRCVLMEIIEEIPNINRLTKQIKQIETIATCPVVLLFKEITRYRRKSLIENRLPFLIDDGQMYLPFLGMDLKVTAEESKIEVHSFTIPAQVAYLYFLYHKDEVLNTMQFAKKMGFNMMSASRALSELYRLNLITYETGGKTGRSKEYTRIPDPEYFQIGKDYLKAPFKKSVYVKSIPADALPASLDALSILSMITPHDHPVVAIERNKIKGMEDEVVNNIEIVSDMNLVELELWDYDPKLFAKNHHVDLGSLYASLKDETDERIEQALEDALGKESWYTD